MPFAEHELAVVRRAFARQVTATAGAADDVRLAAAFAAVPRERFLGPPPWQMGSFTGGYRPLPADPVVLYQDIVVALAPERGVNNGSPSLHASWLHAAGFGVGARIAHIGAGTGYYSAILAELVGPRGQVTAVEWDPVLAEAARRNLAGYAHVRVVTGDGADWPDTEVDGVYVNFLVQRPADPWVERLAPHGRLVLPLGVPRSNSGQKGGWQTLHGAGLCIERRSGGYAVRWLGAAYFVVAEGSARGDSDGLKEAFERGGVEFVRSLIWKPPSRPQRCWYVGPDWSLSYDEVA